MGVAKTKIDCTLEIRMIDLQLVSLLAHIKTHLLAVTYVSQAVGYVQRLCRPQL